MNCVTAIISATKCAAEMYSISVSLHQGISRFAIASPDIPYFFKSYKRVQTNYIDNIVLTSAICVSLLRKKGIWLTTVMNHRAVVLAFIFRKTQGARSFWPSDIVMYTYMYTDIYMYGNACMYMQIYKCKCICSPCDHPRRVVLYRMRQQSLRSPLMHVCMYLFICVCIYICVHVYTPIHV